MQQGTSILSLESVLDTVKHTGREVEPGKWVPARALGNASIPYRLRAAWLVFTGKADALRWPGGQ